MKRRWLIGCLGGLLFVVGCGGDGPPTECVVGDMRPCLCPSGMTGAQSCQPNGTYYKTCLQCGIGGPGRTNDDYAGARPEAFAPPLGSMPAFGPEMAPSVGVGVDPATSSGMANMSPGAAALEAARQFCVQQINAYRGSLGLSPLVRATPEAENCSDQGASLDAQSQQLHGSANQCVGFSGQNTCPNYPVVPGRVDAYPSVEEALSGCLGQMWAEGVPPVPAQDCFADQQGCFLQHGGYITMSHPAYRVVACGFHQNAQGQYWMNQNFGF